MTQAAPPTSPASPPTCDPKTMLTDLSDCMAKGAKPSKKGDAHPCASLIYDIVGCAGESGGDQPLKPFVCDAKDHLLSMSHTQKCKNDLPVGCCDRNNPLSYGTCRTMRQKIKYMQSKSCDPQKSIEVYNRCCASLSDSDVASLVIGIILAIVLVILLACTIIFAIRGAKKNVTETKRSTKTRKSKA